MEDNFKENNAVQLNTETTFKVKVKVSRDRPMCPKGFRVD